MAESITTPRRDDVLAAQPFYNDPDAAMRFILNSKSVEFNHTPLRVGLMFKP